MDPPEARPMLRGALAGWLNCTGAWLAVAALHVLVTAAVTRCSVKACLARISFGAATYLCTWVSDWLHNLDLKLGTKADVGLEFRLWKTDLFSISAVLGS